MKQPVSLMLMLMLFASPLMSPVVMAAETDVQTETEIELASSDVDVDDISEDELTEAEPSDVPEQEEDEVLEEELSGQMLLDVEGNGEVYYVDPVDGGKEYLADGRAAHALLERRALGISEENFAKLVQGTEKDEASVCDSNELGARLRGRIVLRVEVKGEAWWILPTNCRAYYVGTHEAAYNLMKRFSLGITKHNLGKIRDTARQKLKRAVRFSIYAYAEENDVSLEEARDAVRNESIEARACVKEQITTKIDPSRTEVKTVIRTCYQETDLPEIDRERLEEIKDNIREVREKRIEDRVELREVRIKQLRDQSEDDES